MTPDDLKTRLSALLEAFSQHEKGFHGNDKDHTLSSIIQKIMLYRKAWSMKVINTALDHACNSDDQPTKRLYYCLVRSAFEEGEG